MNGHKVLITDSYREQNIAMHAAKPQYGSHGIQWTETVADIAEENGFYSILDYGCGKGYLASSLPNWLNVREYDPAIPGKSDEPATADFVVCTDVLEHIEPDLIDNVLAHIHAVAGKAVLFSVSTVDSLKHLPDGRGAHLIVEDANWWRNKLGRLFDIEQIQSHATNFVCLARPIRELGEINSFAVMPDALRNAHVRINCAATARRLRDNLPAHDRRAVLVCYGPSLKDTLAHVQEDYFDPDTDIICVGASHGFLLGEGILPFACIDCDPRQRNVEQLGKPHPAVQYWLASCVDPSYLKSLDGYDVTLWHIHNGQASEECVWDIDPEAWLLRGGGSVGLRAISLLYSQGYRNFDLHAMDSSYSDNIEYAGLHLGPPKKRIIRVSCNGRTFTSNLSLVDYARQFFADQHLWYGARFRIFGDGLFQEMSRSAAREVTQC